MCAKAEESLDDYFVLFYSCGRFIEGITQSIRDDFIWEFSRENDLANIFGRLNDIASNSGKKVIIFLDALDEFPFEMNKLKNELIQICKKIINYDNIKLVISCKSFDWPFFVIDDGQSFTTLAEKISPHTIKSVIPPSKLHAEKVGYNLQEFTEEELNRAITKYSLAYSIKGEFQGEMLRESRNPLMLRFISEIYGMNKQELPNSITSLELYNLYFDRKISKLKYCGIAEKILYTISEIIFKVTSRSISKDHLLASLPWDDSYEATFSGLLRLGILTCRENNFDKELGFKFHKFFLYICSFKFWKLQQLPCDGRVEKILLLLDSQLGVEVVEFFLPQYNKISQMKP